MRAPPVRRAPAGAGRPPDIALREAPAMRLGCGRRQSDVAALTMGHGERWDGA